MGEGMSYAWRSEVSMCQGLRLSRCRLENKDWTGLNILGLLCQRNDGAAFKGRKRNQMSQLSAGR